MKHDALISDLNNADAQVRLSAIVRIAENPGERLSDDTLEALVHCLGADRKAVQRRAAETLASAAARDPRLAAKLRDALSAEDARTRWGAAFALGVVTAGGALDLRALPALIEALASDDGDVRWAAAELVVRLGRENRDAVAARLHELARDGNLNARKMALYCLRDLGGAPEELLDVAERCCADSHAVLKMAALSLISHTIDSGDGAASLALRLLETDTDAGVRRCAAVALGHLGNRSDRVVAALKRAAMDRADIFMERAAGRALTRLDVKS